MRSRRDSHAGWRELIAARLERPLTRAEVRGLTGHLRSCAECRQVERDYREQGQLLDALPPRIPPRDLWARTSAALDREVARGAYRGQRLALDFGFGERRRPAAPSPALLTTLAALGVVAALGVMQLLPGYSVAPPTARGPATPFAVDPQQLAFIGSEAADVYVYQTRIGHVCPQTEPDCAVDEGIVRTPVNLPASMRARNVALSPGGDQLALVGRYVDRDLIAVLILPAQQTESDIGSDLGPGGEAIETPDSSSPHATDAPPTTVTVEPTPADSAAPAQTPAVDPPTPDGSARPTLPGPEPTTPPASAVPGLVVLAILEDVESAGAPPAWSVGTDMLAFSAMPADGSHGPDVYVWSPNDARARAITTDHGSYFASWSGDRIVASRIVTGDDATTVETLVIDPLTLEERPVEGPTIWLPVVNPQGSQAVAWRGEIDLASGLAVPRSGTLYMIDWAQIDPFGDAAGVRPSPEPSSPAPAPTDAATPATPSGAPSSAPTIARTTAPPLSAAPSRLLPKSETLASPQASATSPAPTDATAAPESSDEPASSAAAGMVAIDLGRDPVSAPVVDWQVRWSTDGQVLGIWIADAAGETWGRLTVLAIDPATHQVSAGEPLLSPSLARRGFTLGFSRVAWVAPSEDNPDGELRIRTWGGDDGVGGLRVRPAELEEVMPAF